MYVYAIRCYVHIASIPKHFLIKKEIVAKSFSKIFGILIQILLKTLVEQALKF